MYIYAMDTDKMYCLNRGKKILKFSLVPRAS